MAESQLKKIVRALSASQHDYKVSTELFGQLSVEKIAKELDLEKIGAEKGAKNQPATSSQVRDEMETKIAERVESAKKAAHQLAEDERHTYNERISNLDFEGHFSEIRQAGPKAIVDLEVAMERGLAEMHTSRRKLLNTEREFNKFRQKHDLEDRTAKVSSGPDTALRCLLLIILGVIETYSNSVYLAKGNAQGLIGGITEALSFTALNLGFSIIITVFGIKQIVRKGFFSKLLGTVSILAWLAVVLAINIGLAHYREVSSTILDGAGKEVIARIIANPFGLVELESWMLFSIGALFALITLIDVITFSDIYPNYTAVQKRMDDELERYKDSFSDSIDELEEIRDEYYEDLKEIGDALTMRQRELDTIIASRTRLGSLYYSQHDQLQRSADALFSIYYGANSAARKTNAPARFNKGYTLAKMMLDTQSDFQARQAKAIKEKIEGVKQFIDEQIAKVNSVYSSGVEKFNNLDKLLPDGTNGAKETIEKPDQ